MPENEGFMRLLMLFLFHRAQLDRLAEMQPEPRDIGAPGCLGGSVRERGGVVRVPPENGVAAFRRGGCLAFVQSRMVLKTNSMVVSLSSGMYSFMKR